MPREPRYRIQAVSELHRQLRYAPRETLLRQMASAEALVAELEPQRAYPLDYVVYRLTGYRPDGVEAAPEAFAGAALRDDLAVLVQRLSDELDLTEEALGRPALSLEAVAQRLSVSMRTLRRYRRDGLLFHVVTRRDGVRGLVCCVDVLERFEQRHRDRLERASSFKRLGDTETDRMMARALALAAEGLLPSAVAARIAEEEGRAAETIRLLLLRHDAQAEEPIFRRRPQQDGRERRLVLRARERGIEIAPIARRFERSGSSVRRAEHRARVDRLRGFQIAFVALPTLELDDAAAVILAPACVRTGLDALPAPDALALVADARARDRRPLMSEADEHALIAAYNFLKRRAAAALGAMPSALPGPVVDAIETDLRWATRLKRRLVAAGLSSGLRAAEQHLARPLPEQGGERLVAIVDAAALVCSRVVETIDPSRGQHLGRLTAYETDRYLATDAGRELADRRGRAAARHLSSVPVRRFLRGVTRWDEALELRDDLRRVVDNLSTSDRLLADLIWGLGPERPHAQLEVAQRLGTSAATVGRARNRILRTLRAALRGA